ncbi:MAG: virulence protein SciE type [Acidobacteriia bacterium]|nr:virulence protein SciE type [Terriglobia bacterium]
MVAKILFDEGKVSEAIQALGAHLRDHPTDAKHRIFLFELLCFAGQYARAEKQLAVLAQGSTEAELGATLYYSALHAEKTRQEMFENQQFAKHNSAATPKLSGNINGKPFHSITDADPDMGARLEIYAAGSYMWLPFQHISSVRIEEPKRLRDTLWIPAFVTTGPSFQGAELGEVLIPVIYPLSYKHPDESVWLGRTTAWGEDDQGTEYPSGQRMLIADGEEIPLLEIRSLEFETEQAAVN